MDILPSDELDDFELIQHAEADDAPLSDEQLSQIQKWLEPTDYAAYSSEYSRHLASHVPSTGSWIRNQQEYQSWLTGAQNALWIRGLPGQGKSVLAASLIDSLKESDVPVLFFFFRQIVIANRTPKDLIRDWLSQLLSYCPPLQNRLDRIRQPIPSIHHVSFEQLWAEFLAGVAKVPKVYCVVDALDEMDAGNDEFLDRLITLSRLDTVNLKLLMTSRPLSRIEAAFKREKITQLRLDAGDLDGDIRTSVEHRLRKHYQKRIDEATLSYVKDAICIAANGLFIHARLMLDSVLPALKADANIDATVRERLTKLPVGLQHMYDDILETCASQPGVSRQFQVTILESVTHASRPLRLIELVELTAAFGPEFSMMHAKETLRNACGPLLEVLDDGTVQVIHHSLTEFLTETDVEGRNKQMSFDRTFPVIKNNKAHENLALRCIKYLQSGIKTDKSGKKKRFRLQSGFEQNFINLCHEYPLLDYALKNWITHVKKCLDTQSTEIFSALDSFMSLEVDTFDAWVEMYGTILPGDNTMHRVPAHKPKPLHVAAYFNLHEYMSHLINAGADFDCLDDLERVPLIYASARGKIDAARVLIDNGAQPDVPDLDGFKPIHFAVKKDFVEVVKLLVAAGVQPSTQITKYRKTPYVVRPTKGLNAMDYASISGSTQVVTYFTQFQDQEALDRCLCLAVYGNDLKVVSALLNHSTASPNAISELGYTALYMAAKVWNPQMVQKLRDHGARADVSSKRGSRTVSTAWRYASGPRSHLSGFTETHGQFPLHGFSRGYGKIDRSAEPLRAKQEFIEAEQTLELLLQYSRDIDVRDDLGRTPLLMCTSLRSSKALELLIRHGANVNALDNEGNSCLHHLSQFTDNDDIAADVRLLLESGANPSLARPTDGKTPLHLACDCFRASTLTHMLDHGSQLDLKDSSGNTALHIAVKSEPSDTVGQLDDDYSPWNRMLLLIERGADVNARNNAGKGPIHLLGRLRHAGTQALVRPSMKGLIVGFGMKRLGFDSNAEGLDPFKTLLAAGGDLELRDFQGKTALHQMVLDGKIDLVEKLVENGAHVQSVDNSGKSVFQYACRQACSTLEEDVLKFLTDHGADPHHMDYEGNTIPHELALLRNPYKDNDWPHFLEMKKMDQVMAYGISPASANYKGVTPLHLLANATFPIDSPREIIGAFEDLLDHFLAKAGALIDLDCRDEDGVTPLHVAAASSEHQVCRLLRAGADPLVVAKDGRNLLHTACRGRQPGVVGMILEIYKTAAPSMISAKDFQGTTPLHDACRSGKRESVELLLAAGASPLLADSQGQFPMHACAEFADEDSFWSPDRFTTNEVHAQKYDRFRPIFPPDLERPRGYMSRRPVRCSTQKTGYEASGINKIIELLSASGAGLYDKDLHGMDPLDYAIHKESYDLAESIRTTRSLQRDLTKVENRSFSYVELEIAISQIKAIERIHNEKRAEDDVDDVNHTEFLTMFQRDLAKLKDGDFKDSILRNSEQFSTKMHILNLLADEGYAEAIKAMDIVETTFDTHPRASEFTHDGEISNTDAGQSKSEENRLNTKDYQALLLAACTRSTWNMAVLITLVDEIGIPLVVDPAVSENFWPLHQLARGRYWWNVQAIEFLINRGMPVDTLNKEGQTPLFVACSNFQGTTSLETGLFREDVVKVLLKHNAGQVLDKNGQTALHAAVDNPHFNADMIKMMLNHGADPAAGKTPIICTAIERKDPAIVKLLLDAGAPITGVKYVSSDKKESEWRLESILRLNNGPTPYGGPPLLYASLITNQYLETDRQKIVEIIKLLLASGARWDEVYREGSTILHGVFETVGLDETLMHHPSINIDARDGKGRNVILAALAAKVGKQSSGYHSGFSRKSASGNIALLLDRVGNLQSTDDDGRNALHLFFEGAHQLDSSLLKKLLAKDDIKTAINVKDNHGFTPFHAAFENIRVHYLLQRTIRVLLDAGADSTIPDPKGNTGLHLLPRACSPLNSPERSLFAELFKENLASGDDINARNNHGDTPLLCYLPFARGLCTNARMHGGVARQENKIIEDLAELFKDADFLVRNHDGQNALHLLARRTDPVTGQAESFRSAEEPTKLFKWLMEKGLDPTAEDEKGRSSLDVASTYGNTPVLDLFREKTAKKGGGES